MRASWLTLPVAAICCCLVVAVAFANSEDDFKASINKEIEGARFTPDPTIPLLVVNETEPNDSCAAFDPANIVADQVNASIGVGGDEDWFYFVGNAGDCVTLATASVGGSSTDTQVYLYNAAGCGTPASYLVWDDDAGPGLFSLINAYALPATDAYYVRVKHYSASGTGAYLLTTTVALCPVPPPNDSCAGAIVVDCGSLIQGTTAVAGNSISEAASNQCVIGSTALGGDVFYQICVPDGYQLNTLLTPLSVWDPAIWFVTDCADATTCVAGADIGFSGDDETLSWVNTTGGTVCLYMIVDSWTLSQFGAFTLEVGCEQVVADDSSTWGAVKALYQE
jgi:hypothetical protein